MLDLELLEAIEQNPKKLTYALISLSEDLQASSSDFSFVKSRPYWETLLTKEDTESLEIYFESSNKHDLIIAITNSVLKRWLKPIVELSDDNYSCIKYNSYVEQIIEELNDKLSLKKNQSNEFLLVTRQIFAKSNLYFQKRKHHIQPSDNVDKIIDIDLNKIIYKVKEQFQIQNTNYNKAEFKLKKSGANKASSNGKNNNSYLTNSEKDLLRKLFKNTKDHASKIGEIEELKRVQTNMQKEIDDIKREQQRLSDLKMVAIVAIGLSILSVFVVFLRFL